MANEETKFNSLVNNAVDFLKKSVRELDAGETKYAVIHFYSGVELFLKARLLQEHWCLCGSDVNKLAQAQFAAGDFESIGLKEARSRLANIVGSTLSPAEEKAYERLRERRNRAVHFFHPDDLHSDKKVAIEQLHGWHFLYRRLTGPWKEFFEPFLPDLRPLHEAICRRGEYYPAIYSELAEELRKRSKQRLIATCQFCRQRAALTSGEVIKHVHRMVCEVCSGETFRVFLPCTKCSQPAARVFLEPTDCQWCGAVNELSPTESFRCAEVAYPGVPPNAWCGDCGYSIRQSIVEVNQTSLCLACHFFQERSSAVACGWCGDRVTGADGDRSTGPNCVRCAYYTCFADQGETAPEYLYDLDERRNNPELRIVVIPPV